MDVAYRNYDGFLLLTAGGSFLLFLLIHAFLFWIFKPEGFSQIVIGAYLIGAGIDLLVVAGQTERVIGFGEATWSLAIFGMTVSGALYTLFVYHYMAWVFGMGEAAIRIRLLRELDAAHPNSLSCEEILQRYNGRFILQSRLRRLEGSGHLVLEDGRYRLGKKILLIQIGFEKVLRMLMGLPRRSYLGSH